MAEKEKEHKLLFKSSEKSNFILNMSDEDLKNIIMKILLSLCIFMPVMCIIAEYSDSYFFEFTPMLRILPMTLMYIIGVISIVLLIVGFLKKKFDASNKFALIIGGIMVLLGIISVILSYASKLPLYNLSPSELKDAFEQTGSPEKYGTTFRAPLMGSMTRNDGFLNLLFYIMLFAVAGIITKTEKIIKFFDFFIGFVLIQCAWAVLQMLGVVTNYYENLMVLGVLNVSLPSGLSGSPMAFSLTLAMGLGISLGGACFDINSKKRRTIYTISACIFAFFSLVSVNIAGIIGMAVVFTLILTITIVKFVRSKDKKGFSSIFLKLGAVVVATSFAMLITLLRNNPLYDPALIYQESFSKLGGIGMYDFSLRRFEVTDIDSTYSYIWGLALKVIKDSPIFGVGPECFILTQLTNMFDDTQVDTMDRPYNDYLYMAVSYGIPFVIAFITMVVFSVKRAAKSFSASVSSKEDGWIFLSLVLALLGFAFASIFSTVNVAVAPFFWIFAGIACGKLTAKKRI